jgi:hypothetical protein
MRRVEVRVWEGPVLVASAVAQEWSDFLNGCWTRVKPRRPGKYVIANIAGRGGRSVRVLGLGDAGAHRAHPRRRAVPAHHERGFQLVLSSTFSGKSTTDSSTL